VREVEPAEARRALRLCRVLSVRAGGAFCVLSVLLVRRDDAWLVRRDEAWLVQRAASLVGRWVL
jgi:hypothetical protein